VSSDGHGGDRGSVVIVGRQRSTFSLLEYDRSRSRQLFDLHIGDVVGAQHDVRGPRPVMPFEFLICSIAIGEFHQTCAPTPMTSSQDNVEQVVPIHIKKNISMTPELISMHRKRQLSLILDVFNYTPSRRAPIYILDGRRESSLGRMNQPGHSYGLQISYLR